MTTPLIDLSHDDLSALHQQLSSEHADLVARGVCLNITRGKPVSYTHLTLPTNREV